MADRTPRNGRREQRPSFQFYPQDFLASDSVAQMTPEEVGLYVLLLCRAWVGPGLPTDVARLARLVGVEPTRFEEIWSGPLGTCFEEVDGRLVNPRMERERAFAKSLSAKRAISGAKGGKAAAELQQTDSKPPTLLQQSGSKGDGMGWDGISGSGSESDAPARATVVASEVAKALDPPTPEVQAALDRWAAHRREIAKPLGASAVRSLLAEASRDAPAFLRRVEASVLSATTVLLADPRASAPQERLTAHEQARKRQFAANEAWKDPDALAGFLEALNGTPKPKEINP